MLSARLAFTAAQAAQKAAITAFVVYGLFTAAQAAQKKGGRRLGRSGAFTAAQAAQKTT